MQNTFHILQPLCPPSDSPVCHSLSLVRATRFVSSGGWLITLFLLWGGLVGNTALKQLIIMIHFHSLYFEFNFDLAFKRWVYLRCNIYFPLLRWQMLLLKALMNWTRLYVLLYLINNEIFIILLQLLRWRGITIATSTNPPHATHTIVIWIGFQLFLPPGLRNPFQEREATFSSAFHTLRKIITYRPSGPDDSQHSLLWQCDQIVGTGNFIYDTLIYNIMTPISLSPYDVRIS